MNGVQGPPAVELREMKASPFEFRYRYVLHLVLYVLGFTAPWNYWFHLDPPGPNSHVWGILAVNLTQMGVGNIGVAFNVLLGAAIVFALAGAWLRTWGAAYLGSGVVKAHGMHTAGAGIVEAGPFRYLRNPLYVGTFLHTLALALLMPRSGAIFTIVAVGVLQVRLILAEESFLKEQLGAAYVAYRALVPSVWPVVRPKIAQTANVPRWGQAVLGEIYMWSVAACFAVLGWRYNALLLIQGVIVSLGIAMLVRAFAPQPRLVTAE
jgi:protein-S-isoprenylcysteine O-methyltransferase Ste14